jgi:hypothetical protein
MKHRKEKLLNIKNYISNSSIIDFTLKEDFTSFKCSLNDNTPENFKCLGYQLSPIQTKKYSTSSEDGATIKKNSKGKRRILILKDEPTYKFKSNTKPYSIIQCKKLTTYYIDNHIFSNFTTPENVDNCYNFKSLFLYPKPDGFDICDFIVNQRVADIDLEVLKIFLVGLNSLYNNKYITILRLKYNRKFQYYVILALIDIFIMFGIFAFIFIYDTEIIEILNINFLILFLIMFMFLLIFAAILIRLFLKGLLALPHSRDYYILQYRLQTLTQLENYVNSWNKTVFLQKNMLISIPVNYKYIHILLEPVELLLEHHGII